MNEARDSLQSKAVLSILDLLGEGQIGGLVNGLQSVYFNDTALQNADGTYNFQGVTADWRYGTNTQTPLPNFGNYIESPYSVGVNVKKATPYTFTVSNTSADAVRVIMSIPALSSTDTGTGDVSGTSVQYKISLSTNNGVSWADQYVDQSWGDGGSWGYESGILTASMGDVVDNKRIRATVEAISTGGYNGYITVQAQEYNTATGWQNLGAERTLRVNASGYDEFGTLTFVGDSMTVESNYPKIRFLGVTSSAPSIGIQSTAKSVATRTTVCTISGKTRSKYQRAHIIAIPRPATNVKIRVTRITDDSTSAYLSNETSLESYYEIVTLNMAYPNSALFGIRIDSQQFNQLPQRSYLVDGLYIQVPTNYDPVARTYSSIWDGTFKMAVSNNPAWVLYDILTNKRYGLGNYLSAAQVDKASLYTIGKYCDESVPDGFGGMEPRFTLNTVIANAGDAYKVVSDITSAFRGMAYWSGGTVSFTQDAPTDPSMIYGRANVVNGEFSYSGSARKDRHSVVHVTWNDPTDNYRKKIEYVEDADLVALYGVKKMDTLAFGCTSRGQAARVGKWVLYTEKFESDFISFKVGVDSALVHPGNVVKIQDPSRAGKRMAGRLIACSTTSATLDAAVTLAAGGSNISLMMPDGTFVDRTVLQGAGQFSTLTWANPLATLPVSSAMWLVAEANLVPIYARVISVAQGSEPATFDITAVEHNPSKFGAIEQNLALEGRKTSILDATFVEIPSQISVSESIYQAAPGQVANKMLITWYGNSTSFDVSYRNTTSGSVSNVRTTRVDNALSLEVMNVALGTYEISITGINPLGKRSTTVTKAYKVLGKQTPPTNVNNVSATVLETGVKLNWSAVTDIDLKTYEVRQATSVGGSWATATVLAQTTSTEYTIANGLSTGVYEWIVRALDTTGHYSSNDARVQLTIASPGTPVVSSTITQGTVKLNWTDPSTTFPVNDYEVRIGPVFASATSLGHVNARTFSVPATWGGGQTFWVVATDSVTGKSGTAGSVAVGIVAPTISGLNATLSGGQFTLNWTGIVQSLPISIYEIRVGAVGSTWATATAIADIASNTYTADVTWVGTKVFFVAPLDMASNVGTPISTTVAITAPTAPAMTAAVAGTNLTLSWPTPTLGTLALDNFEVRVGVGLWDAASIVSTLKGNALTLPIVWTGDRVYQIASRDMAGNLSVVNTLTVNVATPAAPMLSAAFLADSFTLSWTPPAATLPIAEYEIRYGTTWAGSASTSTRVKATAYTLSAQWAGTRRWWVTAIDANGNSGVPASLDVTITVPSAPVNLTKKVVDNNVLLYWSDSTGTLPIDTYKLYQGATFATATEVGKKSGGFTTIFETQAGTYTYWLVAIDTAGNYGTPASVSATVDQPPDYILKAVQDLDFSGTKVNMFLDLDGSYIMPVNTTETFAQHFSARSWTSPDSQIGAGYPVFIEPAVSPGYYEETIDYGIAVPSTKITITTTGQIVAGAPVLTYSIMVRNLATDPWTDLGNTTSAFANAFRYVKVRLTVSGGGTDLYKLTKLNVKLDTKIKSDAGMGVCGASDSVTGANAIINGVSKTGVNVTNSNGVRVPDGAGTLVLFNSPFIDIAAIDISLASGGTAKYVLYDFVDTPYATGLKVLCYDAAGNRVAGSFSWGVRGY